MASIEPDTYDIFIPDWRYGTRFLSRAYEQWYLNSNRYQADSTFLFDIKDISRAVSAEWTNLKVREWDEEENLL